MSLTIERFWKSVLPTKSPSHGSSTPTGVPGWSTNPTIQVDGEFIEAPLNIESEPDLSSRSVLLVSAPGAVGKTTLAKQICACTGSVYVDLATAGTVGADTLVGGLHRANLLVPWTEGNLGLIIDALDEARMRVTEASFIDFLSEIVRLASEGPRRPRIVLFGRTGAIDDARFWLEASGFQKGHIGVMEIGFYGLEKSEEFAESVLRTIRRRRNGAPPGEVEQRAIRLILQQLRNQTDAEGQRFAGYAPVLRAVAERVADETGNMQNFVNDIGSNPQASPVTLDRIASGILERDQQKVKGLDLPETLVKQLYSPEEQLDRLSAELYGTPLPTLPPNMTPQETAAYDAALDTWMQEHPFLDGKGHASCAVFEAQVCVHALRTHNSATALTRQLELGRKVNPFLLELYRAAADASGAGQPPVPAEYVGILYASVRSRLSRGDWANLEVSEPADYENGDPLEFEITICRSDEETPLYEAKLDAGTSMKFGPDLEDVNIDASLSLDVEFGCGSTYVSVVAPVSITCRSLLIHAQHLAVSSQTVRIAQETELAYFEASELLSDIQKVPRVHGRTTALEVNWNWDSERYPYPWTGYEAGAEVAPHNDPVIEEIHRRLRQFVVVCKAGLGKLGRSATKFENNRMGRGWGRTVLNALVEDGVFRKEGEFYHLNPSRLSEVTGLTYGDCRRGKSTPASIGFATQVRDLAEQ